MSLATMLVLATSAAETARAAGDSGGALSLTAALTIFVLAIFVGIEVITKVPPTLHTPLMSGSNAISGITIVGAIVLAGLAPPVGVTLSAAQATLYTTANVLGMIGLVFATINAVGGFLVTDRMLRMFRRK